MDSNVGETSVLDFTFPCTRATIRLFPSWRQMSGEHDKCDITHTSPRTL